MTASFVASLSYTHHVASVQGWLYGGTWVVSTLVWQRGGKLYAVAYNAQHDQYRHVSRFDYGDLTPWALGDYIT
jgi:hypothetical protein